MRRRRRRRRQSTVCAQSVSLHQVTLAPLFIYSLRCTCSIANSYTTLIWSLFAITNPRDTDVVESHMFTEMIGRGMMAAYHMISVRWTNSRACVCATSTYADHRASQHAHRHDEPLLSNHQRAFSFPHTSTLSTNWCRITPIWSGNSIEQNCGWDTSTRAAACHHLLI